MAVGEGVALGRRVAVGEGVAVRDGVMLGRGVAVDEPDARKVGVLVGVEVSVGVAIGVAVGEGGAGVAVTGIGMAVGSGADSQAETASPNNRQARIAKFRLGRISNSKINSRRVSLLEVIIAMKLDRSIWVCRLSK